MKKETKTIIQFALEDINWAFVVFALFYWAIFCWLTTDPWTTLKLLGLAMLLFLFVIVDHYLPRKDE